MANFIQIVGCALNFPPMGVTASAPRRRESEWLPNVHVTVLGEGTQQDVDISLSETVGHLKEMLAPGFGVGEDPARLRLYRGEFTFANRATLKECGVCDDRLIRVEIVELGAQTIPFSWSRSNSGNRSWSEKMA